MDNFWFEVFMNSAMHAYFYTLENNKLLDSNIRHTKSHQHGAQNFNSLSHIHTNDWAVIIPNLEKHNGDSCSWFWLEMTNSINSFEVRCICKSHPLISL